MITKEQMKNSFIALPFGTQERILEIVANFHHRNGLQHPDKSMGEIKISPAELKDAISYLLARERFLSF